MSMFGLHHIRGSLISLRLGWAVMALALLSSCSGQPILGLGDKATSFEVKSLIGGSFVFRPPLSGSPHILYFWADWCPRCEDDFRLMEKLYQRLQTEPHAPRFLAIDVGQSEEHVQNFVKRMKISFPVYMDHDGKVARSYGVKGLPTYFLIDGQGSIKHIILGWADEKTLLGEIGKMR